MQFDKYKISINKIFHFSDGRTVFVGEYEGNVEYPTKAILYKNNIPIFEVQISAISHPLTEYRKNCIVVETTDTISLDNTDLEGYEYTLIQK